MTDIIGTYKIVNKTTGKLYYGSSKHIKTRFTQHKSALNNNRHHCIHLQRAYEKYGKDNFEYVIDTIYENIEDALEKEQNYIDDYFGVLYNTSKCVCGGDNLSYHPRRNEIIEKIKQATIRNYTNMSKEERKKKWGMPGKKNPMYGKTHSKKARDKISKFNKGKKYALGLKRSIEVRRAISERGKKRTGKKNPFYGRHHTEETKEKIRQHRLGKLPTNIRAIIADGVEYISVTEASRQLNVCLGTIIYRLKKGKYHYKEHQEITPIILERKKKMSDKAKKRIGPKSSFYGKRHSEKTKEKLRQQRLGKKLTKKTKEKLHRRLLGKIPTNAKAVIINNKEYLSISEAARDFNVTPSTIARRIKKRKPGYKYKNDL